MSNEQPVPEDELCRLLELVWATESDECVSDADFDVLMDALVAAMGRTDWSPYWKFRRLFADYLKVVQGWGGRPTLQ